MGAGEHRLTRRIAALVEPRWKQLKLHWAKHPLIHSGKNQFIPIFYAKLKECQEFFLVFFQFGNNLLKEGDAISRIGGSCPSVRKR